jgi:dTDP-4-amino-4,6-dideoxygalactose transaminase
MAISALARQYGIALIEDASHALGGSYQGDKIGSCTRSDAAVFSFHPVKMITTGEGGMVVTNRHDISKKLLTLRAHGITRNQKEMVGPSHGPWYYEQTELGYNYRITDIQAALGLSQLRRLDVFLERRREIARIYSEALEGLPLTLPWEHPDCTSAYHLYPIQIAEGAQATRLEVFRKGFENGDFPNAEFYYERCMSLPIFPALARPDQDSIIAVLKRCFVV